MLIYINTISLKKNEFVVAEPIEIAPNLKL